MNKLLLGIMLVVLATLSACGFQLRQTLQFPYQSIYLDLPTNSAFTNDLKRKFAASSKVVSDKNLAEAIFIQLNNDRNKTIISIDNQGLAREFQLQLSYRFRLINNQGVELMPANAIFLKREFSYSDAALFAKAQEEALLWKDIENDLIEQIAQHLATYKSTRK